MSVTLIADEIRELTEVKRSILVKVRHVQIGKFCEVTGYTKFAIYGKIREGVWREGIHYRRAPDGHIFIDIEAFNRWVEGQG